MNTCIVFVGRVLQRAPVLVGGIVAAFVEGQLRAQDPPPTPRSLEQRLAELEHQLQDLQQQRAAPAPSDASARVRWVAADTAGVPDLQDASRPPQVGSTVDVKLWGRVNFAASYDNFQGAGGVGGPDFYNYITAEGNEDLDFNPRDTRFGVAAANTWDDWTGRAVFETDFYGDTTSNNLAPRLRLGYVELVHTKGLSLRAGQDWAPVAQQNPGTLDFGILAWSGNLWGRVPQVTVRYKWGQHETLLSAMHARTQNLQDQQERMPWVLARHAWTGLADGKGLLAIGAGARSNDVENAAGTVRGSANNYLVALEARVPVGEHATITAEAWTGSGIGRDFQRTGLDYSATATEIDATGGFVSLEWKLDERWIVNVGAGIDQPHDDDTTPLTLYGATLPFDANHTWFANVRYQLSKQAGLGFEVIDGRTELVDGVTSGDDGQVLRGQRFTIGTWFLF